jgi:hypothetical protein
MIQSHTVDQHCQGSRAGTVAGLAQSPLTRLRSVPIPKPIEELAQTPVSSDLPRAIARTAVRVRVPFFTLPTSRMSGDGFFVLQQWEGKVSDVSGEDVTAVVRDWTNPTMPDEEVTVSIDEFSPDDQSLLAPGTVFYWSIGYRTRSGTRERVSSFQLRRIPPPSAAQRARAEKEGAVLKRLLGSNDLNAG